MTPQDEVQERLTAMRATLQSDNYEIRAIKRRIIGAPPVETEPNSNELQGEALANITLALRHVEDARMRLGKVLQAYQGGVSIFDRPPEPDGRSAGTVEELEGEPERHRGGPIESTILDDSKA